MSEPSGAPRPAPVAPRGINHLVLNVRNMEESHRFWCGLLGFEQVGELHPRPDDVHPMVMRFYGGVTDGVCHHDLALVERPELPEPAPWNMYDGLQAVNHVAVAYPDRQSWLRQVQFLLDSGVEPHLRIDHGMTHSLYISDPNGYGVEVLYELPEEVWRHDVDGALNHAVILGPDEALTDDPDYPTEFDSP